MRSARRRNLINESAAVDPLSLASTELFLRSDQVLGADGSAPAAWTNTRWSDLSSHARHATLGLHGSPHLRTTGANLSPGGKQVVQFGGVTEGLDVSFGGAPISGAAGWSFIAYYKSVALSAGHNNNILQASVGKGLEIPAYSNVAFNGYDRDSRPGIDCTGVVLKTFDPINTTGWHMLSVICSPPQAGAGVVRAYLDGVLLTPTFAGWDINLESTMTVGNSIGSNSDLEGCLAALVVNSEALSDANRLGIETNLHLFCD